ncbi:unnamed protein product [Closterium sp. Naga37s-1]|nr:unnamed protein product [Closterium sp. Naga37s-1]
MSLVVIVVAVLLICESQLSVMAQMPPNMPGGQIGGEAGIELAMSLFQTWEEAYGLKPDVHLPPAKITLTPMVPPAPHLEDCSVLTAARKESERCGGDGEPPLWARHLDNCSQCNQQPPWVRGSDADNPPLTDARGAVGSVGAPAVPRQLRQKASTPLLLPIYLPTSLPVYFPTSLPVYLPTSLPVYLPTSLPVYLPTSPPSSPRACLPPNQVRGSNVDNLPRTRVAQRDLWEHQLFHVF